MQICQFITLPPPEGVYRVGLLKKKTLTEARLKDSFFYVTDWYLSSLVA